MSQRQRSNYGSALTTNNHVFNISPSQKNSSKSPFSTSKKVNQTISNQKHKVSYGQLQIVLENIQQIRKKASHQIKIISNQNEQLRQMLKTKQSKIQQSQIIINKYQEKLRGLNEIIENQNHIIKQKQTKIENQDNKLRQLQKHLNVCQQKIKDSCKQIENNKKRWKWAFDILCQGQQKSQQFIWKVKNQYKNGLWVIMQENKQIKSQLQITKVKINDLQSRIADSKQKNNYTGMIVQKSLAQIDLLKNQNIQIQKQLKKSANIILTLQTQITSLESQLKSLTLNKAQTEQQLKIQLQKYQQKIANIEKQLDIKDKQASFKQEKRLYQDLIQEVCDDSQNYDKLTQRIRYLQKFRNQFYFNVQKIQYLCKFIDQ